MRFQYNGKFYAIWFEHHTDAGSERLPKVRWTGCTIAEITGPKEATELITEDAICAASDNFCKAVGRKLALGRALIKLTSDRMFRRTAWMAYLNRGKVPQTAKVIDVAVAMLTAATAVPAIREAKPLVQVDLSQAAKL